MKDPYRSYSCVPAQGHIGGTILTLLAEWLSAAEERDLRVIKVRSMKKHKTKQNQYNSSVPSIEQNPLREKGEQS